MTFSLVNLSWTLFRADSIGDALIFLRRFLWLEIGPVNENLAAAFLTPEIQYILKAIPDLPYQYYSAETYLPLFYFGAAVLFLGADNAHEHMDRFTPSAGKLLFTAVLFAASILTFGSVSTFLYFNF